MDTDTMTTPDPPPTLTPAQVLEQMVYRPVDETEALALKMALMAGCLYHTYGPGRVRRFYKVHERNADGTFTVEPSDAPEGME